jgi:4-aminobutyrate aminotransferase-like enzyme
VITFEGSYFGRTIGVVGLAGKARYREALGMPPAGSFVPFPYPHRMGPDALAMTMARMERVVDEEGDPAAVIVEPIQGNGGVVVPPAGFLPALRELSDRTGALLIFDEIQSGCGRTGRMWACEHVGVVPDLMTVGKGIGGGLPVAAVLGRSEVMRWQPDSYTSTFLTNNLTMAAATAAVGVIREEGLPERAARLGPRMHRQLHELLDDVPGVAEVRGLGLWAGVELVDEDGRSDAELAAQVVRTARAEGVLVGRGGHAENVVKLSPPLVIDGKDLRHGVEIVAAAVRRARTEVGA